VNGTKANLSTLPALFADCDCKVDGDRERYLETLHAFPLRPTLIVWSGGGFHVYWILRDPIDVADTKNFELIEQVLRGIAARLAVTRRSRKSRACFGFPARGT